MATLLSHDYEVICCIIFTEFVVKHILNVVAFCILRITCTKSLYCDIFVAYIYHLSKFVSYLNCMRVQGFFVFFQNM